MFKKAKEMTFGVTINTVTGNYHIHGTIGQEDREPEAHAHLNRVGSVVKTLPDGFYVFTFKPVLNGLFWNYEYTAIA